MRNRKAVCLCLKYTLLLWWWFSLSVMPSSFVTHGLYPTRLLCPWNFPGKNTGAGCCFLLQRISPTQGSNLHLLHCRRILHRWANNVQQKKNKKQPHTHYYCATYFCLSDSMPFSMSTNTTYNPISQSTFLCWSKVNSLP